MKLTQEMILNGYCQGIFPMAEPDGTLYWYDPNPRAILPLDALHIPRSLGSRLRRKDYEVRFDSAFDQVIRRCAEPGPGREETWISDDIIESFSLLHESGFAHSVETWMDGELVGGLYGVSVAGLFAGESMFSGRTDASKIALIALVDRLRERGFGVLDVQFSTDHLTRFGVTEISRSAYKSLLKKALEIDTDF
jgi:leucyl/phenylalanyl-tRNA--protein transferase